MAIEAKMKWKNKIWRKWRNGRHRRHMAWRRHVAAAKNNGINSVNIEKKYGKIAGGAGNNNGEKRNMK